MLRPRDPPQQQPLRITSPIPEDPQWGDGKESQSPWSKGDVRTETGHRPLTCPVPQLPVLLGDFLLNTTYLKMGQCFPNSSLTLVILELEKRKRARKGDSEGTLPGRWTQSWVQISARGTKRRRKARPPPPEVRASQVLPLLPAP